MLVKSNELKAVLQDFKRWDFNVFNLLPHTTYPLALIAETAIDELMLVKDLDLNEVKLRKFLISIQQKYKDLPYHNYMHAADVTQTIFHMCTEGALIDALYVNNLGALALIIGACIHDVGHPGVTGKFLIANSDPLAIQYNDLSPLENMHLSLAFQIWGNSQHNFTEKMPWLLYKDLRKMIIDMVLATDNDMHFTLFGKVNDLITSGELNTVIQAQVVAASSIGITTSRSYLSTGCPSPVPMNRGRLVSLSSTDSQFSVKKRNGSLSSIPTPTPTSISATNTVFLRNSQEKPVTVNRMYSLSTPPGDLRQSRSMSSCGAGGGAPSPDDTPRNRPARVASIVLNNPTTGESSTYLPMKAQQVLVLQVALHAADISGPAKPWDIHTRWTSLVMDEFYKQGDKERELNAPITFAFDRYNPVPMPKFQVGFIKAIVSPLYKTLSKISGLRLAQAIDCLENNTKKWESKMI